MRELHEIMVDSAVWEVVVVQHRTVGFRNDMFKLGSAFACAIAQQHLDVHMNFPWAGVFWLFSPHGLKGEYDKIKCKDLLGDWFGQWCAYWDSMEGLDSREAIADLVSVIILMQEDNAEIEALHASIRRELYLLSTQVENLGLR